MTKLEDSFVECILKNNIKKAKYIIKLKADVTKGEYQGHTPLMAAVVTENIEILEIILDNIKGDDEKIACLTATSFERYSPFTKAVATGNSEIIERILDSIKDKEKRVILANKSLFYNRRSAISYARNAETVRVLLKSGADPYLEDDSSFNAFFWHAHQRRDECIRALTEQGFDIDKLNSNGNTMLIQGLDYPGDIDTFERLLANGANVNAQNRNGKTALIKLAENKYNAPQVAQLLFKYKADVNIEDYALGSAIKYAGKYGNFDLAKVLIEHGAKEHNSIGQSIYSYGMIETYALKIMSMFRENKILKSKIIKER